MKTLSAIWTDELGACIASAATEPYLITLSVNSEDYRSLVAAVNQGIDAHLEAVRFTEFPGDYGKRGFSIDPESVPVLVRRLMESDDDNSQSLASSICETLGID